MKKTIAGLLFAGSLFSPFVALADNTPVLGSADPNLVTQAWGLTGYQTPHVAAGAYVVDRYGYREQCPNWYPKTALGACQNITGTDYYESRMNAAVQSLIAAFGSKQAAAQAAPMFAARILAQ